MCEVRAYDKRKKVLIITFEGDITKGEDNIKETTYSYENRNENDRQIAFDRAKDLFEDAEGPITVKLYDVVQTYTVEKKEAYRGVFAKEEPKEK